MPEVGTKPLRTLAVTSGKGGVGKTNLSLNLAISMAHAGHKVLLLDADLGLANVDVLLGLRAERNLSHVLASECRLEDVLVRGPSGIQIIPASSGLRHMAQLSATEHAGIVRAFSELETDADVLIVDTGAGIADNVVTFCRAVQDIVVVICDEPASITDAYALLKVLDKDYGVRTAHVVVNMVNNDAHGLRTFEMLRTVVNQFLDLELSLLGSVPSDDYLRRAVRSQQAVVDQHPLSKSTLAFRALAARIHAWPAPPPPAGHLQFFVEQLLDVETTGSHGFI